MLYQHKVVTRRFAAIFVNTHVRQLEWKEAAEKGKLAKQLFKETFEFEDSEIELYLNLSKQEMIAKFDKMQQMADEHEKSNESKEKQNRGDMLINLVWIGHTLYLD